MKTQFSTDIMTKKKFSLKINFFCIQYKKKIIFSKLNFLEECFVMSYVICRICQILYLYINLNLNCLIHKTVANVISRICQMSKLWNLQKKSLTNFLIQICIPYKKKIIISKKKFYGSVLLCHMSYVASVKFHTYQLI